MSLIIRYFFLILSFLIMQTLIATESETKVTLAESFSCKFSYTSLNRDVSDLERMEYLTSKLETIGEMSWECSNNKVSGLVQFKSILENPEKRSLLGPEIPFSANFNIDFSEESPKVTVDLSPKEGKMGPKLYVIMRTLDMLMLTDKFIRFEKVTDTKLDSYIYKGIKNVEVSNYGQLDIIELLPDSNMKSMSIANVLELFNFTEGKKSLKFNKRVYSVNDKIVLHAINLSISKKFKDHKEAALWGSRLFEPVLSNDMSFEGTLEELRITFVHSGKENEKTLSKE
ncbi:hypothetical protein BVX99_01445 [bacterium F16]|nr:hypothetical protein BVX99_01445 [bacterium F16]